MIEESKDDISTTDQSNFSYPSLKSVYRNKKDFNIVFMYPKLESTVVDIEKFKYPSVDIR